VKPQIWVLEFTNWQGEKLYATSLKGQFGLVEFPGDGWGFHSKEEAEKTRRDLIARNPEHEGMQLLKAVQIPNALLVVH